MANQGVIFYTIRVVTVQTYAAYIGADKVEPPRLYERCEVQYSMYFQSRRHLILYSRRGYWKILAYRIACKVRIWRPVYSQITSFLESRSFAKSPSPAVGIVDCFTSKYCTSYSAMRRKQRRIARYSGVKSSHYSSVPQQLQYTTVEYSKGPQTHTDQLVFNHYL